MNRLFGKAKENNAGPNMTDCIAGVCIFYILISSYYIRINIKYIYGYYILSIYYVESTFHR